MKHLACLLFAALPAILLVLICLIAKIANPGANVAESMEPMFFLAFFASAFTVPVGVIALIVVSMRSNKSPGE